MASPKLAVPKSQHHIRPSVILLALRIAALLLIIETIYAIFLWIGLKTNVSEEYYRTILSVLLVLHSLKYFAELAAVAVAIFPSLISHYYLSEHQLISYVGLISIEEKFFELSDMKSIVLEQSIIGKLFNYGSLVVEFSSSGFHEKVYLYGIHDPKKYEHILRTSLDEQPPSTG
jgi:hypothetical protein